MFSLRRKTKESGIVMVTVLMMSAILMILTIGIVATNVSDVTVGQKEIDRIKSEQMTRGGAALRLSRYYADPTNTSNLSFSDPMDGKTYTVQDQYTGPGPVGGTTAGAYNFSNLKTRSFTVTY